MRKWFVKCIFQKETYRSQLIASLINKSAYNRADYVSMSDIRTFIVKGTGMFGVARNRWQEDEKLRTIFALDRKKEERERVCVKERKRERVSERV